MKLNNIIAIAIIVTLPSILMYVIGLPAVLIGIAIGAFFFIGAPIYAIFNNIEKTIKKMKEAKYEKTKEAVFESYLAESQKD